MSGLRGVCRVSACAFSLASFLLPHQFGRVEKINRIGEKEG